MDPLSVMVAALHLEGASATTFGDSELTVFREVVADTLSDGDSGSGRRRVLLGEGGAVAVEQVVVEFVVDAQRAPPAGPAAIVGVLVVLLPSEAGAAVDEAAAAAAMASVVQSGELSAGLAARGVPVASTAVLGEVQVMGGSGGADDSGKDGSGEASGSSDSGEGALNEAGEEGTGGQPEATSSSIVTIAIAASAGIVALACSAGAAYYCCCRRTTSGKIQHIGTQHVSRPVVPTSGSGGGRRQSRAAAKGGMGMTPSAGFSDDIWKAKPTTPKGGGSLVEPASDSGEDEYDRKPRMVKKQSWMVGKK